METVNNVRIKDLMSLLCNLHYGCEAVDITVSKKEGRVIINGTEEQEDHDNPNKVEIKDKDLGEIM